MHRFLLNTIIKRKKPRDLREKSKAENDQNASVS